MPYRMRLLSVTTVHPLHLQVEFVGGVSDGVEAVSWSPDLELAALVTSQPALLLITAEFEPVAELPLFSEEFGDSESGMRPGTGSP